MVSNDLFQVEQNALTKEEVQKLKLERLERERDVEQSRLLPVKFRIILTSDHDLYPSITYFDRDTTD